MHKQELERMLATIRETDFSTVSSIDQLMEYGFMLKSWMAFGAEEMVKAKRTVREKRKEVTEEIIKAGTILSPSILKDYISDKCGEYISYYELAERTCRTCTHTLGFIVTCISALKEEMKLQNLKV